MENGWQTSNQSLPTLGGASVTHEFVLERMSKGGRLHVNGEPPRTDVADGIVADGILAFHVAHAVASSRDLFRRRMTPEDDADG